MNRLIVFGAFLILSHLSWSQVEIQGVVIDQSNKQSIPYVNIGVLSYGKGTVSDNEGRFQLTLPDAKELVTFSAIGYETKEIETSFLMKNGEVVLVPKSYNIPAIDLSAKRFGEEEILGAKMEEREHSVGFGSGQLGTQIGALIPIEGETLIKSAHFYLNHAKGDSLLFRVNLYEVVDDEIGQQLLSENVFLYGPQEPGELSVDLSEFHLSVDNDVLLGLEWIKDDNGKGNQGITFRSRKSRKQENTYYRMTSQGAFIRMSKTHPMSPKLQLGFYLVGKVAQ